MSTEAKTNPSAGEHQTISEVELGWLVRSNAVRRVRILQNERHRYLVLVTLTASEAELGVITTRKRRREWASLDRLADHIQRKYGLVGSIALSMHTPAPAIREGEST